MSTCPCGRSPDPGVKSGGGCWCAEKPIAYFKVRGPQGYYRRRFPTSDEAQSFAASLQSVVAFNSHGKVVWAEPSARPVTD